MTSASPLSHPTTSHSLLSHYDDDEDWPDVATASTWFMIVRFCIFQFFAFLLFLLTDVLGSNYDDEDTHDTATPPLTCKFRVGVIVNTSLKMTPAGRLYILIVFFFLFLIDFLFPQ